MLNRFCVGVPLSAISISRMIVDHVSDKSIGTSPRVLVRFPADHRPPLHVDQLIIQQPFGHFLDRLCGEAHHGRYSSQQSATTWPLDPALSSAKARPKPAVGRQAIPAPYRQQTRLPWWRWVVRSPRRSNRIIKANFQSFVSGKQFRTRSPNGNETSNEFEKLICCFLKRRVKDLARATTTSWSSHTCFDGNAACNASYQASGEPAWARTNLIDGPSNCSSSSGVGIPRKC